MYLLRRKLVADLHQFEPPQEYSKVVVSVVAKSRHEAKSRNGLVGCDDGLAGTGVRQLEMVLRRCQRLSDETKQTDVYYEEKRADLWGNERGQYTSEDGRLQTYQSTALGE